MFLTLLNQSIEWEWARSWKGTQLGQLAPNDQKDIPYHMMPESTIKVGENEVGNARRYDISLPKLLLHMTETCFPEMPEHLPADAEW